MNAGNRVIAAEFYLCEDGEYELLSLWHFEPQKYGHSFKGYDVGWCKRDQQYSFHQSSGGPGPVGVSGPYWATDGAPVTEIACQLADDTQRERNFTRRMEELPIELNGCSDLLDWLGNHGNESSVEWCSICDDHIPTDDLCEHIWWCEENGWYSTPDERFSDCVCEDCVRPNEAAS